MSKVADAYNNPFFIDGESSPPMRSAFAILNVDREDLGSHDVKELLEAALETRRVQPALATVYGRPVTELELREAAKKLTDPKSRLIGELLDFGHDRFDIGDLPELRTIIDEYKSRITADSRMPIADLSVLGLLMSELLGLPPRPPTMVPTVAVPELPEPDDLVSGLA